MLVRRLVPTEQVSLVHSLVYSAAACQVYVQKDDTAEYMFGAIAGSGLAQASDPTSLIRLINVLPMNLPSIEYRSIHSVIMFTP